jgi:DNA-binding GntR family transcriptional regulator
MRGSIIPAPDFRNASRADYVFRALREDIREGRLKQGERLREEDVARRLGVSRTPVREALRQLAARGLVADAPGRGLLVVELSKRQVIELYAMRRMLEGAAARFAAQHASPGEAEMLRRLAAECRDARTAAKAAQRNRAFHLAIYEAAHNRYLQQALDDLGNALALLPGTTFRHRGRAATAYAEHMRIADAIARRDADAAEAAARAHIAAAERLRWRMMFALEDVQGRSPLPPARVQRTTASAKKEPRLGR